MCIASFPPQPLESGCDARPLHVQLHQTHHAGARQAQQAGARHHATRHRHVVRDDLAGERCKNQPSLSVSRRGLGATAYSLDRAQSVKPQTPNGHAHSSWQCGRAADPPQRGRSRWQARSGGDATHSTPRGVTAAPNLSRSRQARGTHIHHERGRHQPWAHTRRPTALGGVAVSGSLTGPNQPYSRESARAHPPARWTTRGTASAKPWTGRLESPPGGAESGASSRDTLCGFEWHTPASRRAMRATTRCTPHADARSCTPAGHAGRGYSARGVH